MSDFSGIQPMDVIKQVEISYYGTRKTIYYHPQFIALPINIYMYDRLYIVEGFGCYHCFVLEWQRVKPFHIFLGSKRAKFHKDEQIVLIYPLASVFPFFFGAVKSCIMPEVNLNVFPVA